MFNYVLIFVSILACTLSQQNQTLNQTSEELDSTSPAAAAVSDHDNCYYICPTWPNVIVFGAIITLLCCICAAVCQQQPREIFYLVDRLPEDRPPSIPLDPKVGAQPLPPKTDNKTPQHKSQAAVEQPIITEPITESPDPSPQSTKSVKIDISPQDPDNMTRSQIYSAQESIEDDPIPLPAAYTQPSSDETPVEPSP